MQLLRSLLLYSFLPLLALTLSAEIAARMLEPQHIAKESNSDWEGSAIYGLRYKPGFDTIDGNTFNNVRPFVQHTAHERLAIVGDSYIQGLGAAPDALPALIEERLRSMPNYREVETMNFGLSSGGPVHYFIRYQRIVRHYDHTLTVVSIHDNDVLDSSELNPAAGTRPIFERDAQGEIIGAHFAHRDALMPLRSALRRSALYRILRFGLLAPPIANEDPNVLPPWVEALGDANRSTVARTAKEHFFFWLGKLLSAIQVDGRVPYVVYLPGKMVIDPAEQSRWSEVGRATGIAVDFSQLDSELASFCQSQNIAYFSLRERLLAAGDATALYLLPDEPGGSGFSHFTAAGNALVAPLIAERIAGRLTTAGLESSHKPPHD